MKKKPEILTPRLRLAVIEERDRDALIRLVFDPEIGKTFMVPDLDTEESRNAVFERYRSLSESDGTFAYGIFLGGKLIGVVHQVGAAGEDATELGYFIDPAEKNKGYASEALSAAVEELFSNGCRTVIAGAFEENRASLRVMEKCGFVPIGKAETVEYRGKTRVCVMTERRNPKI